MWLAGVATGLLYNCYVHFCSVGEREWGVSTDARAENCSAGFMSAGRVVCKSVSFDSMPLRCAIRARRTGIQAC